jgi:hypothetical protein
MDFQFSGAKLCEMMLLVTERVGSVPKGELEAALVTKFPDEKERKLARTAIIVLAKCYDTNRDYADVKKVIVWRDRDGKPHDIQIEF